jgi:hypothetical protein
MDGTWYRMNVESLRGEAGRVIGFMYQLYTKSTVAPDVALDVNPHGSRRQK